MVSNRSPCCETLCLVLLSWLKNGLIARVEYGYTNWINESETKISCRRRSYRCWHLWNWHLTFGLEQSTSCIIKLDWQPVAKLVAADDILSWQATYPVNYCTRSTISSSQLGATYTSTRQESWGIVVSWTPGLFIQSASGDSKIHPSRLSYRQAVFSLSLGYEYGRCMERSYFLSLGFRV
jgi:hypothetical protein